jgi:rhodanese-related sulfurtransferase
MTPMGNAIDTDTVRSLLREGSDIRILDVRTPGEFETVHIPGSYNVPLDTLGEHAGELARRVAQPVVLVCASGNRASQAEKRLQEAGMDNLKILSGGITEWQAKGGDVRRLKSRWGLERQVRLVAGSLVLASVVASILVPSLRYVAGFVGAGLAFSAVTNTCGMAMVLARLPYNRSASCDIDAAVAALTAPAAVRPTVKA